MTDGEAPAQIAKLEMQIEQLADAAERCRKFIFAARLAIVIGALWLLATLAGVLPGAGSLIGATAALIGGIVVFGTNTATLRQLIDSLAAAERLRQQLIDRISLTVVPSERERLR